MKLPLKIVVTVLLLGAVAVTGCKQSMVISKVDYSQSIESVLEPNDQGIVKDVRHGLTFNVKPLQYAETRDTSSITVRQVRYIRGKEGFYYITAPNFSNVYVMSPEKGKLKLTNTLGVSESGLSEPALNQRTSYIQLLSRETGESWKLFPERAEKEKSQMADKEG